MRRFFPYILILILFVGVFTPFTADAFFSLGNGCAPQTWYGFQTPFPNVQNCLTAIISSIFYGILTIMALLLMIFGLLLDFVIEYSILDIKENLQSLTGINTAWKILKDLMNIAFIFILLFEAIKLIIGQGSREYIKRFIIGIVLASILINFSLFFTKVLIDASNVVTVGLYEAIIDRGNVTAGNVEIRGGLTVPFMRAVGITSFYSNNAFEGMVSSAGGRINLIFIPLLGIFLFLILCFVFLAISVMFIVRFLAILVLLVLSPVAYMGLALDFMKPYASQWWNALNSQLIFPPVFMLMMLVSMTIFTSPGFITVGGNWGGVISENPANNEGFINLLFKFTIIIGLSIASLIVSANMSKKGSTHIATATSKFSGYAGGVFMGGAGRLGRSTIGRWGGNVANDEDLKDRAAKGDIRARLKLSAANRLATSSFDARATDSFGTVAKATGFGSDFGKVDTKKTNYRAITEQRAKDEAEKVKQYYKVNDDVIEEAKKKDKATKEAEEKLNSEGFINEENRIWQQTEEGKDATEKEKLLNQAVSAKNENDQKIEENRKKLKELQKQLDWTESQEEKVRIQTEMDNIRNDDLRRKSEIENLNKAIEDRKKIYEEAKNNRSNFKSDERRRLEEITALGKDNESKLKERYKERVNDYANRIENGGVMYRYGSVLAKITGGTVLGGVVGGIPGAFVGGGYALSQTEQTNNASDRRVIARKIRGLATEKSKKEKAEEATREYMEEQRKKEEEEKNQKTEEKPEEPTEPKVTT